MQNRGSCFCYELGNEPDLEYFGGAMIEFSRKEPWRSLKKEKKSLMKPAFKAGIWMANGDPFVLWCHHSARWMDFKRQTFS